MAKARASSTRIATTVTARFFPTTGATDGFYLDGRISGRREHRAADITLDREERGFCYAVFAHPGGGQQDEAAQSMVRKSMDRIMADVKQNGKSIDTEINELAESAVTVVGRASLKMEGVRQPYFAGVIVRDSEMAAVTMGAGCAYLYRNDILYPLTNDDYQLEAIDQEGKPVAGLDVYSAGVAGTVRYSNIAQLQVDDCLILCNREVMEAIGQREMLRMLYDAEDQADAAGMIITAASAKLPGTPMQYMIGFVESIVAQDRTGRFGFTRNQSDVVSALGGIGGAAAGGRSAAAATTSHDASTSSANPYARPGSQSAARTVPGDATAPVSAGERFADRSAERAVKRPPDDLEPPTAEPVSSDSFVESDASVDDEFDSSGRVRRIAFYTILAAVCIGCIFLIAKMIWPSKAQPTGTTRSTTTLAHGGTGTGMTTTGVSPTETTISDETTATDTTTTVDGATTGTTEGTETTTTTTTELTMLTHSVVRGDTLYGISMRYYRKGDEAHLNLIRRANNLTTDIIHVGQVLQIPVDTTATSSGTTTTARTNA